MVKGTLYYRVASEPEYAAIHRELIDSGEATESDLTTSTGVAHILPRKIMPTSKASEVCAFECSFVRPYLISS